MLTFFSLFCLSRSCLPFTLFQSWPGGDFLTQVVDRGDLPYEHDHRSAQMHTTLQCILLSSLQTNIVMLWRSFSEMLEMLPSPKSFLTSLCLAIFFFWLHSLCKDAISHSHICQWQIACAYFRQHSSLLEWDTYIQSPHPHTHTHTQTISF